MKQSSTGPETHAIGGENGEPAEQVLAAEQDERRRIALFLHDGPVQSLAALKPSFVQMGEMGGFDAVAVVLLIAYVSLTNLKGIHSRTSLAAVRAAHFAIRSD